jgi:hypothetical protein
MVKLESTDATTRSAGILESIQPGIIRNRLAQGVVRHELETLTEPALVLPNQRVVNPAQPGPAHTDVLKSAGITGPSRIEVWIGCSLSRVLSNSAWSYLS